MSFTDWQWGDGFNLKRKVGFYDMGRMQTLVIYQMFFDSWPIVKSSRFSTIQERFKFGLKKHSD